MIKKHVSVSEKTLVALALILANLRAFIFIFLFPDTSVFWGPAWIEIILWILIAAAFTYFLIRDHAVHEYLSMWRKNWLLALFVLLTFISIFWSIGPVVTLYRVLELLFATLIAAYIGMYFQVEDLLEILFWFGAGVFMLSIALVYGAPKTGTMYWNPFYGAWRGVYWHRNHLASIAALLNAVYLCRALLAFPSRNPKGVLDGFFYLVSLAILYYARSATGYIVFFVLNVLVIGIWLWLHNAHRLRRQQYLLTLGGTVIVILLVLLNLNSVLGLLHRDSTLSGRVTLWSRLLNLAAQRLWLGHGFGAVWTFNSFRDQIQQLAGWTAQPLIGDNGFLDIFLHLGIIGLAIFIGVLLIATVRAIRYGIAQKTLLGFLPLLIMVYAFVANITFSLFAETEVFVWSLIVVALFMATPSPVKTST